MAYRDRPAAGRSLAARLAHRAGPLSLVLGLPRGGVPVAAEIARALHAPLDAFLVRKLGAPQEPELAIGAVATGDVRILNAGIIAELRIDAAALERITAVELRELERRELHYRAGRRPPRIGGRTVIIADDGAATGATMRAALAAIREQAPARLIAALPVAPPEVAEMLAALCDELICPLQPPLFVGVGRWYEDFTPPSDDEVRALLDRAAEETLAMNDPHDSTTPHPPYDELRSALGDHPEGHAALDDLHASIESPQPAREHVESHVERLRGIPAIEARIAVWYESPRTQNWLKILNDAGL